MLSPGRAHILGGSSRAAEYRRAAGRVRGGAGRVGTLAARRHGGPRAGGRRGPRQQGALAQRRQLHPARAR